MSNPFYTASGNPGTGSEGLSATMRAEFFSIQTAFDLVPRISTTGLFTTVFNQLGNYTFTLPSISGVLATTANITTETVRATAAEAANAAAITAEATARATAVSAETTRALAAEALLAPKASPALTGVPTAPTAAPGTNTTQVSTTAFDTAAIAVETSRATTAEALLAPKASPALTGVPTAPTAAPGTNTTQVGTTAFSTAAVLVETTRALAAEATKQASLGYTPVQQGTGIGQGSNTIKIGYDGSNVKIKATVDVTDFGNIALEPWVTAAVAAQFAVVHNVSGSRALSTTYTNTTGKIMFVTVQIIEPGSYIPNTVDLFIYINGVQSYYISTDSNHATATYGASGSVMVPPLSTYSAVSNAAAPTVTWMETY
jgi:hypothetical protein